MKENLKNLTQNQLLIGTRKVTLSLKKTETGDGADKSLKLIKESTSLVGSTAKNSSSTKDKISPATTKNETNLASKKDEDTSVIVPQRWTSPSFSFMKKKKAASADSIDVKAQAMSKISNIVQQRKTGLPLHEVKPLSQPLVHSEKFVKSANALDQKLVDKLQKIEQLFAKKKGNTTKGNYDPYGDFKRDSILRDIADLKELGSNQLSHG